MMSALVEWGNKILSDLPSSCKFNVGEKREVIGWTSIYQLYDGSLSSSKRRVTIFYFDKNKYANLYRYAQQNLNKSKSIKHPNFLQIYETLETSSAIYVVSERVTLLSSILKDNNTTGSFIDPAWIIYQLVEGVNFLHQNCKQIHGMLIKDALFISDSGEWKLGLFDLCTPIDESVEAYENSLLDHPFFNSRKLCGNLSGVQNLIHMERQMLTSLLKDISLSTQMEPSKPFDQLLRNCTMTNISLNKIQKSSFFTENPSFQILSFLNNFVLNSASQKEDFFKAIQNRLAKIPSYTKGTVITHKLVDLFSLQESHYSLLSIIFFMHDSIERNVWETSVIPIICQQFTSTDRTIRFLLLQNLSVYSKYISESVATDLFESISYGFTDSSHVLREATLISMTYFIPKYASKTSILDRCLRLMIRLVQDPQPHTRANVAICFSQILGHLSEQRIKHFIIGSYVNLLHDSHPDCRLAVANSIIHSIPQLPINEVANKIVPGLASLHNDPDIIVRRKAIEALELIVHCMKSKLGEAVGAEQEKPTTLQERKSFESYLSDFNPSEPPIISSFEGMFLKDTAKIHSFQMEAEREKSDQWINYEDEVEEANQNYTRDLAGEKNNALQKKDINKTLDLWNEFDEEVKTCMWDQDRRKNNVMKTEKKEKKQRNNTHDLWNAAEDEGRKSILEGPKKQDKKKNNHIMKIEKKDKQKNIAKNLWEEDFDINDGTQNIPSNTLQKKKATSPNNSQPKEFPKLENENNFWEQFNLDND